jgi:hypothetical protein
VRTTLDGDGDEDEDEDNDEQEEAEDQRGRRTISSLPGSVVGNGFPPIIPIMDLKPDASTRKNSPRTTDKGTARAVPETAETSPKVG